MGDCAPMFEVLGCSVLKLTDLSADDSEREKLLLDLIERERFGNVFLIGSTMGYDLLPEIRRRYPSINVIDQQFNDGKHMLSNQRLHQYIDATVVPSEILAGKLRSGLKDVNDKVNVVPHGIRIPTEREMERSVIKGRSVLPADAAGKFVVSFFRPSFTRERSVHVCSYS